MSFSIGRHFTCTGVGALRPSSFLNTLYGQFLLAETRLSFLGELPLAMDSVNFVGGSCDKVFRHELFVLRLTTHCTARTCVAARFSRDFMHVFPGTAVVLPNCGSFPRRSQLGPRQKKDCVAKSSSSTALGATASRKFLLDKVFPATLF